MRYLTARATKNSDRKSNDFLCLNNCGAFSDTEKTIVTARPSGREDFQLIYISRGNIEITEKGNRHTVGQGNVILFRPSVPQMYRVPSGSTFYWIHFSGTAAEDMLGFFKEFSYTVGAFPEFEDFCKESVSAFAAKKANYELYCVGQLISLIALISQKLSFEDTVARQQLSAALLDIHTNFTVQRTNDDYASMCGLSKSHFIRIFHKCIGMPPQKYRAALAMREAKHLLKSNSVSDTAAILGYTDVFYFSRIFKKTVGMSPSEYKNR